MQLLLDNHIARAVAEGLRRAGVDAVLLADWVDGRLREADDELILAHAAVEGRVLVTYDCDSIPPLLTRWAHEGRTHAGVVLVDHWTIRQDDRRGLIRALRAFTAEHGEQDWRDRVMYLPRA